MRCTIAIISALTIPITADAAALGGKLKQAEGMLGGFAHKAGTFFAGAAAATTAGLAGLTGSAFKEIDNINDAAVRTGASVEGLARLQHAANLSGTSLEGVTAGLGKMVRSLGEATSGNKEAEVAFNMLGLSAQKLAGMDSATAFVEIAHQINALPNTVDRATAAFGIFGKGAQELLPLLNNDKAAFAAMATEADRFGLTLSALDVSKVAAANDAIDRMWAAFTGLGRQIAAAVAPSVEAAVDRFTDLALRGMSIADSIATGFGVVIEVVTSAVEFFARWSDVILASAKAIGVVVIAMKAWTLATKATASAQAALLALSGPKGWAILAASVGITAVAITGINTAFKGIEDAAGRAADAVQKATDTKPVKAFDNAANAAAERLKMIERGQQLAKELRLPSEVFENSFEELQKLLDAGAINWATFARGVEKAVTALEGAAGVQPPEPLKGAHIGSREAAEAIIRHQMGDGKGNLQERIARAMEEVREQARKTADGVQELVRQGRNAAVVDFGQ